MAESEIGADEPNDRFLSLLTIDGQNFLDGNMKSHLGNQASGKGALSMW